VKEARGWCVIAAILIPNPQSPNPYAVTL